VNEDERTTPSIRHSVPPGSDRAAEPAARRPEQVPPSPGPKGSEARSTRWVTGAATVLFALCVAYGGVEAWGAGRFKLDHEQHDQRPIGYFLVGLGLVMVFVLPVLLLILAFRRHRPPREERDRWAPDAE
jgi:hypothetical protein